MKKTTNFQASNSEDVSIKDDLDEKILKMDGHLSLLETDYNELKLQ